MRGARARLVLRRAEQLGTVTGVMPPAANFEREEFDGRFTFRLDDPVGESQIIAAIEAAGEIASVAWTPTPSRPPNGGSRRPPCRGGGAVGRSGQIRVDLRRLDALMKQVGELVVAKNRLLAARAAGPGGEPDARSSERPDQPPRVRPAGRGASRRG